MVRLFGYHPDPGVLRRAFLGVAVSYKQLLLQIYVELAGEADDHPGVDWALATIYDAVGEHLLKPRACDSAAFDAAEGKDGSGRLTAATDAAKLRHSRAW